VHQPKDRTVQPKESTGLGLRVQPKDRTEQPTDSMKTGHEKTARKVHARIIALSLVGGKQARAQAMAAITSGLSSACGSGDTSN
jgi:hypothetical protein